MTTNATTTVTAPAALVLDPTEPSTAALIRHIRAEVKGAAKYDTYVKAHGVTAETVKVHAAALAALAFPSKTQHVQKIDGIRTPYGNAVQAAGNGMRRALKALDPAPATDAGSGDADGEADEAGTDTDESAKNLLSAHGRKTFAAMLAEGREADVLALIKAEVATLTK